MSQPIPARPARRTSTVAQIVGSLTIAITGARWRTEPADVCRARRLWSIDRRTGSRAGRCRSG
jgi:hypothetical protein